jgi:acyl-CoA synthetase (AMP-forming)/AMP-acid ligase II
VFRPEHAFASLVATLRERAASQPERSGFFFYGGTDPDNELNALSYGDLDRRARAIAARLQRHGTAGQRVLLLQQPGAEFVTAYYGTLYAGAIAVTTYPFHRSRLAQAMSKLRRLLLDSGCHMVLTTSDVAAPFCAAWRERFGDDEPVVLASETIANEEAAEWQAPVASLETVAFLQYTSGSTREPRGVAVTHGNLLHNAGLIARKFGNRPGSVGLSWLPPYHDMGLIGAVIEPVVVGFPSVIMPPHTFLQHPVKWLRLITRVGATVTGGPNFAYDLCVRRVSAEQIQQLDLSSWTVAYNGAEPIHPDTLERFSSVFSACGFNPKAFYPCYGLAESTLFVTGGTQLAGPIVRWFDGPELQAGRAIVRDVGDPRAKALVGCGDDSDDQKVHIVDPDTGHPCPHGVVGEVWVSGASVARGYWQRDEDSLRVFGGCLTGTSEGPFLRTGDLGVICDGELFITGRIKDLIILNGRNLYPQDLEFVVQNSHPGLAPFAGAAFAVEVDGEERLGIAQEVERKYLHCEPAEMVIAIREALMREAEVQPSVIALLKPAQVPRTSSGKVQRSRCRTLLLDGALAVIHRVPDLTDPVWSAVSATLEPDRR